MGGVGWGGVGDRSGLRKCGCEGLKEEKNRKKHGRAYMRAFMCVRACARVSMYMLYLFMCVCVCVCVCASSVCMNVCVCGGVVWCGVVCVCVCVCGVVWCGVCVCARARAIARKFSVCLYIHTQTIHAVNTKTSQNKHAQRTNAELRSDNHGTQMAHA